ncbi:MAG: aldolase catalytic domain-containing protein [Elusimicrobia bacterium]|nr:aldolase catalytic domain-containing protein [Elusimicrobiota bacterium]
MRRLKDNNKVFNFEILDCTIRDGGYLNDWNFDEKMVKELYRNVSKTGVSFIEIGFRNLAKKGLGKWCSTPEKLINDLFKGLSGIKISLMVDFGRVDLSAIPNAKDSRVKMYRVACHRDKVVEAIGLCEKIKQKGYLTSIQLMGIVGYTQKEVSDIIRPLSKSSIDYVYFADSYGSLFPRDIKRYIGFLKPTGKKIGFHAHNGLQLAFANTLEAISNGIDIVDGTVYGMGRGAGNLPLEVLIIYLEKTLDNKKYNSMPLMDLIDRYFIELQSELKWGYSLPYMLSGIFEVHPNYAKKLVDYHEYKADDIVKVLEVIKDLNPVGFNKDIMEKVINSGFVSSVDELEDSKHDEVELKNLLKKYPIKYKDRHAGRDFLILANGPSLKEHKKEVDKFIKKYNPVIMGANYLGGLFKPDYHAFSNKKRFINYIDQVSESSKLLLSSTFDKDFIQDYTNKKYETMVHLNRVSNCFKIKEDVITSNCRTVSILLIGVAIVMGARRVFIAGMDGYKSKENFLSKNIHFYKESEEAENFRLLIEKHNWNEALLKSINIFLDKQGKEGLHIITPTNHKYFYNSIYNWIK